MFKRGQNRFKILLEKSFFLPGCVSNNCVSWSFRGSGKIMVKPITEVCNSECAATLWLFLFKTKNQQLCCLEGLGHNVLPNKTNRDYEKGEPSLFSGNSSATHNQPPPKKCQKKQNSINSWHNFFDLSLVDRVNYNSICSPI